MDPTVKRPRAVSEPPETTVTHPVLPQDFGAMATPSTEWHEEPSVELKVGDRFGDFEVLSELGRGGMGVVYKARQMSLDRAVALKVLRADPASHPTLRARFLTEARAGAALTHPNIPTIYQTGECLAGPYCAMEYIDGKTLETIIQGRVVSIGSAVGLLFRVTGAVHHAHSKGIIHRDLKPGNIMLDKTNRPVVMDFGLSKMLDKSTTHQTMEGDIVGTPMYMPPEQARGDLAKIGPCSDVYSLGAILYRLLAGQPPYGDIHPLETLLRLASAEMPPPVREFRPEVPQELEQICMKCLAKDPAGRYPSANALAADLRRVRTAAPQPKRGPATMRPIALQGVLQLTWSKGQVPLMNGPIVIGRGHGCDIELAALTVSERHCRILVDATQHLIEVEDLGSAAGTTVNGKPVRRSRLKDGDRVDVGGYVFVVRLPKPKAPPATPRVGS